MSEKKVNQEVKSVEVAETKTAKKDFKNKKPQQRKYKDSKKDMTFLVEETINPDVLAKLKKIK